MRGVEGLNGRGRVKGGDAERGAEDASHTEEWMAETAETRSGRTLGLSLGASPFPTARRTLNRPAVHELRFSATGSVTSAPARTLAKMRGTWGR